MDTSIEAEVTAKKKRKTILVVILVVIAITSLVFLVRATFQPTLLQDQITTAVVQKGDIENTIDATGQVLPEFEQVISSPISASIQKVLMDAGSRIKAGQPILTLDKSATRSQYEKMKFELESKRNDIKKLRLDLNKSFYDIKSNNAIKQLRINSLEADVENAKRLLKAGGGTRQDVEQAELNLKVANLEKQQLENEIKSKQQTMQLEIREAEIAADIQQNDLEELDRKLKEADIKASRDGVITWVNKNIGASIQEGEAIARIADLTSFKVAGTISDNYIDQLRTGMEAIIRINDTDIRGTVVNVYPAVQNGIVSFDVQLNEQNTKLLRPNLKVDVYLVTATHTNIMRVANGPAFKGASPQDIFVLKNGVAERRSVHTGMSNFDYVELKDNVKPGDLVITSDMSGYKNLKRIVVKN